MPASNSALRQTLLSYQNGAYPFTDASTFTSTSGRFVPPDAFLDARVYPIGGRASQYVSRIAYANGVITLTVSDDSGELCSGSSSGLTDTSITLIDSYAREVGIVIIDRAKLLTVLINGESLDFELGALDFVATAVIPNPVSGVVSIEDAAARLVSGDVWLIGEAGVVLDVEGDDTVTVHLVGDPLFVRRACEAQSTGFNAVRPLRFVTVNGGEPLSADEYGDFKLSAGTGSPGTANTPIRITPVTGGIQITLIGRSD